MKTPTFLALCFLAVFQPAYSQSGDSSVFHESRLLFAPLQASHLEPRVGLTRLVQNERLRLDIGNSIDIATWKDVFGGADMAIGADFFTWTSLRQEKDFHFPVDAVDYLFGLNASYRRSLSTDAVLSARLRISHISAHLVDGSFDKDIGAWREQLPRVYSREFFEGIVALEYLRWLRVYAGLTYIYHIDPPDLGKWHPQGGVEAAWISPAGLPFHPYVAVDVRAMDVHGWGAAVSTQIGVKIGRWRGSGVDVFIAYYEGKSQHGEYHDRNWAYWGPGFNISF
ncbi:DUF1207 domain-containing protein [bacterium]|nr:DUF1207 domain-containing protein [bacterium]